MSPTSTTTTTPTTSILPVQCSSYTTISDATRRIAYTGTRTCDLSSFGTTGTWVRFMSPAGATMPTSAPSTSTCGTDEVLRLVRFAIIGLEIHAIGRIRFKLRIVVLSMCLNLSIRQSAIYDIVLCNGIFSRNIKHSYDTNLCIYYIKIYILTSQNFSINQI
ncbi:unnamed protein product [Rotaria socialis]|uniref:Uncharacterized protein n=1 Tax=Rotaria socialis TaxID=392032 RepID=A0A818W6B0_9BILA|nr:unnamed protein product [Rotaria socialis]CAF4691673.1 unnamed protein product [Rotaria socialis]